eukprot:3633267-Rhodomonas_salina.1
MWPSSIRATLAGSASTSSASPLVEPNSAVPPPEKALCTSHRVRHVRYCVASSRVNGPGRGPMVRDLGSRGLGPAVQDLGSGVKGLGPGEGLRVWGLRVWGLRSRV